MVDATNPFGNKKLALIKDGIVIDILLVDPNDTSIEATLIELKQADFAVTANDDDIQAIVNGHYFDGQFYDAKRYPSWVRNDEHRNWEAPIPYPDATKRYQWDEDALNWVEVLPAV
jgi:hypothetical protein